MRQCANPLCANPVEGRSDKRWCADSCRKAVKRWLASEGYDVAEWEAKSRRFWTAFEALMQRGRTGRRWPKARGGRRSRTPPTARTRVAPA
jgi:alkylation response protein AidB-like acyl-CoA dehydrogenase